jgi:hypothetical protein
MQWHQDDLLYTEPQCEFVLTLENGSDSHTEWVDRKQVPSRGGCTQLVSMTSTPMCCSSALHPAALLPLQEVQSIWTEPNSVIALRAGEVVPALSICPMLPGLQVCTLTSPRCLAAGGPTAPCDAYPPWRAIHSQVCVHDDQREDSGLLRPYRLISWLQAKQTRIAGSRRARRTIRWQSSTLGEAVSPGRVNMCWPCWVWGVGVFGVQTVQRYCFHLL